LISFAVSWYSSSARIAVDHSGRIRPQFCPYGGRIAWGSTVLLQGDVPLDVGEFPGLVEKRLGWTIEPEEDFECSRLVGGNPVGFAALRWVRTDVDVY
jgi:hypothetical protein